VTVELLALIAGVQQIQGIFVVDMDTTVEYPQEKALHLLVDNSGKLDA